jgi:hypothetical protein
MFMFIQLKVTGCLKTLDQSKKYESYMKHRRLCRVKNMLAMYLNYHKAGLTPTTPVTSTAISPVNMSIGRISLTNFRSEMIFPQGKHVFFLYLLTIYTPILTDNPPIVLTMDNSMAAKVKIGHVISSTFRSFSGFIIALRNIYEKFIFWRLVI